MERTATLRGRATAMLRGRATARGAGATNDAAYRQERTTATAHKRERTMFN